MIPIISLLVALIISLLITRIATVALTLTGLSQQSARFQARSAFTGVGFTTTEAEKVVNHPVRRRILMLLMLLGNVGIVTVIASIILTFVDSTGGIAWYWSLLWLTLGLGFIWIVATSQWLDQRLSVLIGWALKRWAKMDVRDYAAVLHLSGDYGVMELQVEAEDWLAEKRLADLDLPDEGVLVLGIRRLDGTYVGAPKGPTRIKADDTLLLYGRSPVLADLDQRRADITGEAAHHRLVAEQRNVLAEQEREDPVERTAPEDTGGKAPREVSGTG